MLNDNSLSQFRIIHGVGINDADYNVNITKTVEGRRRLLWRCPFYVKWKSMLTRCYYEKYRFKHPSYKDCCVCEEWLRFSKFKAWMEVQDWEGKELDKDLLIPNNKVYGPETCLLISSRINQFLLENGARRGDQPIGVYLHRPSGKFLAQCFSVTTGKKQHLGYFDTPEEAHEVWKEFKLEQAKILASEEPDKRIAEALIKRYEKYETK